MTLEEYKQQFSKEDAVGWLSIDKKLSELYPDQEPKHFDSEISYKPGGEYPLDRVSLYKSTKQADHHHFVTYGFSNLYYDEESAEREFSKWGFELTFRLKHFDKEQDPAWVVTVLQKLAKYVFNSKKWFEEFHFISAVGLIQLDTDTNITALAFILDPELGKISTPNGEISFLQMVGLTTAQYEELTKDTQFSKTEKLLRELQKTNPLLITDLNQK